MFIKKRYIITALILIVALLVPTAITAAEAYIKTIDVHVNTVNVAVNDKLIEVDNFLYEGTTYIPLRAVSEALGADVGWDDITKTANISLEPAINTVIQTSNNTPVGFINDSDAIEKACDSVFLLVSYDKYGTALSTGSGFIAYDTSTLVTNYHVIEDATFIEAIAESGESYFIYYYYDYSVTYDIALLKIEDNYHEPLKVNYDYDYKRGDDVLVIGSPKGLKNILSTGIISAVHEVDNFELLQFTAPISPGSSGGPVFNANGEVIGISTMTFNDAQNLNVAVSVRHINDLYDWHINYSKLQQ
jgi:S1-C subfamily serine protease